VQERLDEVTGLSRKVVIESKAADLRPRITIKDRRPGRRSSSPTRARRALPPPRRRHIVAQDGDIIEAGEVIAKIPRETTKVQDITGGLPRVAELFEARKPKDHAIITEIDGEVSFGKDTKGKRKVVITPFDHDGTPRRIRPASTSSPRASTSRCSRATASARASRSWTARRTRTTSCA
jgi:DNA-directed RNA polymerase subunit beta'